jgi:hypothetical protein
MEEYGESKDKDYPRGRGYGNDYMRGGEVFGGYGYQERADYDRPRGEESREREADREADEGERAEGGSPHPADTGNGGGPGADGNDAVELFPQDERAGGWDVPHDFAEDPDAPDRTAAPMPEQPPRSQATSEPGPSEAGADAPEPQIEHTFGDTGGYRSHSRSYYVTQAQLQWRIYGKEEEAEEEREREEG